jgi:TolB-like protein
MMRARWVIVAVVCGLVGVARAERAPIRLAVMDFTPATPAGELDALGVGLQSMITTDLAAVPAFVLVERARLKDLQAELKLGQSGAVDKATAARLGQLAGATHLLVGSFTVVGARMRLDARLFAVASGEIALGEKIEGEQAAFFELEKTLVKRLVDAVGVKLSKAEKTAVNKPQTQNLEAFQKYSQALVLADEKRYDQAIAAMEVAVARDPGFALAAAKLAELRRLAPPPAPPERPQQAQCRPNPVWSGPCLPEPPPGAPPAPPVPTTPTVFAGTTPSGIVVRAEGTEVRCVTPCQLHLPPGRVTLEVLEPVRFTKQLDVGAGPSSVTVTTRNRTNLIVGSVLAAFTLAMVGATVGLHEAPINPGSTSQPNQYWPVTLSLATGAAFPAIFYLLNIGKNDARVTSLSGALR